MIQVSGRLGVLARPSTPACRTLPGGCCAQSVDELEGRWWVLHTKPRNEKVIAHAFDCLGVAYYLPLVRHQRLQRSRTCYVDLPLFSGYVFLCGDWGAREMALKTNRVVNVLEVNNQERLKADLRQIEQAIKSGLPVDVFPGIRTGARCRVKSGPLAGVEGVVLRRRSLWRVSIAVDFIGKSAELEIDAMLLEVIDRAVLPRAMSTCT